jgi:4-hydroxybenzoate polyprenyltransferase/phosphoserine phosphatase
MSQVQSSNESRVAESIPAEQILFVDLDGTLLRTDLLIESLLPAFKQQPLQFLLACRLLFLSRSQFKLAIAKIITPCVNTLPYRKEIIEFMQQKQAAGIPIVLATASEMRWARPVAEHVGLFSNVLASHENCNLKGTNKRDAILAYCELHNYKHFGYIGDSQADIPIWNTASHSYLINPTTQILRASAAFSNTTILVQENAWNWYTLGKVLRVHQWVKNVLVFVPLITAHQWNQYDLLVNATLAFLSLCLCASGIYIINDLCDLYADRQHTVKRFRPFASGTMPALVGIGLSVALILSGLVLAAGLLPLTFLLVLLLYVFTTIIYSLYLKRLPLLDVLTLATLYSVRVWGGGTATGIVVSEWLMAFSLFIFVSLAYLKRHIELARLAQREETQVAGRGYLTNDIGLIEQSGITSGYLAVLVLSLYIQSEQSQRLYRYPWALWLLCPLLLYWISRLWLLARRDELNEDPVVFALRDVPSLTIAFIALLLIIVAAL